MSSPSAILSGFKSLPLPVAQLSLAAVLQCGQSFRWAIFPLGRREAEFLPEVDNNAPTHEYRLCLKDRVVCLRQSNDTLFYRSVFPPLVEHPPESVREAETLLWLRDYFQLDIDLLKLYDEWSQRDPVFCKLRDRFSGIRILRQDPFECLLSFICSSNNNIKRITKMVKSLCTEYSPALLTLPPPSDATQEVEDETYYPFPPPSNLAHPDVSATLRKLGFGYRADFIQKTAKMLVDAHGPPSRDAGGLQPAEKWLRTLRTLPTVEARAELIKLMGVGRKVADCVLLMSLDKAEVVPVDTHVYDIARKHYGLSGSKAKANMTPQIYDQVNTKLTDVWGPHAGWAHSVLFTSDLKAFASYGLSTPTPSAMPSPSPSPRKRSRVQMEEDASFSVRNALKQEVPSQETELLEVSLKLEADVKIEGGSGSMADRVKRRRRGKS